MLVNTQLMLVINASYEQYLTNAGYDQYLTNAS